jgi:O-antigen/teichoic acid export membrane protein
LMALCIGLLASTLYLFIVNLKYHKVLISSSFKESNLPFSVKQNIKKYSLPLFILGIIGILYQSSDRIMLSYFGDQNIVQIGYLGMAQRIVGVLTIGLSGVFTVWGVKAFENYSDTILMKEKEKLIGMMLLVFVITISIMIFLKPFIVYHLLTKTYSNSFPICVLLIGIFINNRIREILEKYFLKQGDSKLITSIFVFFGIFSFLLSALSLYLYDLEMMLMTRLFLAFIHSVTLFYLLNKLKLKINPFLMATNFAFSIIIVLVVKFGLL